QLHEDRQHALERRELAMRHSDAVAQAGRAQRLAVVESVEGVGGGLSGERCNLFGELEENVALARNVCTNKHRLLGKDVGQFHKYRTLDVFPAGAPSSP